MYDCPFRIIANDQKPRCTHTDGNFMECYEGMKEKCPDLLKEEDDGSEKGNNE